MPNRSTRPSVSRFWFALPLALLLPGCVDTESPTAPMAPMAPVDALSMKGPEEEIFGSLYVAGQPITSGSYYVTLQRIDHFGVFPGTGMWVNPSGYGYGWMYGWFDTEAWDGPCSMSPRGPEIHLDPESIPGTEIHCVTAGNRYRFTLYNGDPSSGNIIKQYDIDYPRYLTWYISDPVRNNAFPLQMEGEGGHFFDAYISVDLAGSGSDQPVLWIDNAGPTLGSEDGTFTDTANPTGTTQDYFRFNAMGSTYTTQMTEARMRRPMARLWFYRNGVLVDKTDYYTYHHSSQEAGLLRTRRFSQPGNYSVALDLMRPEEAPAAAPSANAAWRSFVVDTVPTPPSSPTACYSRESASTWKRTPQTLDATCTTGAGSGATYQWRWTTNSTATSWSSWTPASVSPVFDFAGHPASGTQYVELKVNATNGTSDIQSRSFSVTNSQVVITGQTLICAKSTNTYSSNVSGTWLERQPPSTTWTTRATGTSTYSRVWSAGTYDVILRQDVGVSPLRRGELLVYVRTEGGCSGPN